MRPRDPEPFAVRRFGVGVAAGIVLLLGFTFGGLLCFGLLGFARCRRTGRQLAVLPASVSCGRGRCSGVAETVAGRPAGPLARDDDVPGEPRGLPRDVRAARPHSGHPRGCLPRRLRSGGVRRLVAGVDEAISSRNHAPGSLIRDEAEAAWDMDPRPLRHGSSLFSESSPGTRKPLLPRGAAVRLPSATASAEERSDCPAGSPSNPPPAAPYRSDLWLLMHSSGFAVRALTT